MEAVEAVGRRFNFRIQRLIPWFGYHHWLIILDAASIIFLALVLAGCSSYSTMTSIYVASFAYSNSTQISLDGQANTNLSSLLNTTKGDASLEVRVGYFGLCANEGGAFWFCSGDSNAMVAQFGSDKDPLNIIWLAKQFQSSVIFSGFLFMAIILAFCALVLFATFPGWHYEHDEITGSEVDVKPFPSKSVMQVCLGLSVVAAMTMLVMSLWQHTAAVAARSTMLAGSYGNVSAEIGAAAIALSWISCAILFTVTIGVLVMLLSMSALDRLTRDDGSSFRL